MGGIIYFGTGVEGFEACLGSMGENGFCAGIVGVLMVQKVLGEPTIGLGIVFKGFGAGTGLNGFWTRYVGFSSGAGLRTGAVGLGTISRYFRQFV